MPRNCTHCENLMSQTLSASRTELKDFTAKEYITIISDCKGVFDIFLIFGKNVQHLPANFNIFYK
ncbi:MAG: hypothetical protein DBX61_11640 [Clostridiales bacterium]|nr:MAG: hypothetical protein DBX61_11640 [Clostridiales bacterium]